MSSLENMPASLLTEIPVGPPPSGVIPNFVNPPNSGYRFIIFGGVLLPIMLSFFSARIYSRLRIIQHLHIDDLTCSIATIGIVLYYTTLVIAITKGQFGKHDWDTSVHEAMSPQFAVPLYIIEWLGLLILPFVKVTFFLFYLQLFRPFRWIRILCYTGVVCTTALYLGFLTAQLVLNTPHPGQSWRESRQNSRSKPNLYYLSIPIMATSFAADIYIFVLPIMGVAKLQLSSRRKFGVLLVFLTGFMACIASFLSLYYQIRLSQQMADSIWASVPVTITVFTEMAVGVIVSCMPSLACIVQHHAPDFSVFDSCISVKTKLNSIRPSVSGTRPLGMRSHDKIVGHTSLDNGSKKSGTSSSLNFSELGNVAQIVTRAEHSGTIEIGQPSGIRVEHSWQQILQG